MSKSGKSLNRESASKSSQHSWYSVARLGQSPVTAVISFSSLRTVSGYISRDTICSGVREWTYGIDMVDRVITLNRIIPTNRIIEVIFGSILEASDSNQ